MVAFAPVSAPSLLRAVVFLPVGLGLLVGAAYSAQGAQKFLKQSETATGTVLRLLAGPSHPEIGFVTRTGLNVSYPQGGLVGGYRPGQPVRVRYLAADPGGSASVDRWGAVWGPTIFLLLLGGVFSLGGVASAVSAVRR